MNHLAKKFQIQSAQTAADEKRFQVVQNNIRNYRTLLENNQEMPPILETLRTRAYHVKENVINNLEYYLKDFEKAFSLNGGKIVWANDAATACQSIVKILRDYKITKVVKTNSLEIEELALVDYLKQENIEVTHSNIANYINDIAGEQRSHVAHPAFHSDFETVSQLFHEKMGTSATATPDELIDFMRGQLRSCLSSAEASITGADFLIADSGALVLNGEEGNQLIASSMPKVQIVVAGIERIIPGTKELEIFQLLSEHYRFGRLFPVYANIITAPRKSHEKNGVEALYLVLINNGRDQVLNRINQRKALYCIKCGACATVCPVYQTIGGQCVDSVFSGPIGTVLTPLMQGIKTHQHLCYACTLCGRCAEICPVKIPINDLIVYNRYYINKLNAVPSSLKRQSGKLFRHQLSRKKMNRSRRMKHFLLRKIWHCSTDDFSERSFNELFLGQ